MRAPEPTFMTAASSPSLARWLAEHGDYLYRFAYFQLHDAAAAEDAVQDTLIAAWEARAQYEANASERTWLTAILKNKIADYYRRTHRESPSETALSDADIDTLFDAHGHWRLRPAAVPAPSRALEDKQFWRVLSDCLAGLSATQARAFMLAEFHEISSTELCKVLQLSASNVWVVLHRARMRLRACFEAHWLRTTTDGHDA